MPFANDTVTYSGMTSFDPPPDPKVNERWNDEAGDLWIWDGKEWVLYDDPLFPPTSTIRES
jgi:hypothetical protein